jgi:WD40 repeat protein
MAPSKLLPLVLASIVAALALAVPASASTIFYIHANNIWAANPDGSGQRALTADGTAGAPYLRVASAKQGSAPPLAFLRYDGASFVYGTMGPDGSGAAANPASAGIPMQGTNQGNYHELSIDMAGDRVAWTRASNSDSTPYSVGVNGSNELEVSRGTGTVTTTFGDTAGQSLLFDDIVGSDYSNPNNDGALWPHAPAPCTAGVVAHGLVRQAPQPHDSNVSGPAPIAYYCETSLNLLYPALSPDGQTIAAAVSDNPGGPGRLVTIPIGGAASDSSDSPLSYVTPIGSAAAHPDFSPDGSALAFEDTGSGGIDTVPAGGGQPTPVIPGAISPAWSPYTLSSSGGGPAGGSGNATGSAPAIRAARLVKRRVHAKQGISLQVTLASAGTLRVQLARRVVKHRHARYRSAGSVSFHAKAGRHNYTIKKLGGQRLKPGTYRLTIFTASGKARSKARKLTVTVTR